MPRSWSSAARSFGPNRLGWDAFAHDQPRRPYSVTALPADLPGPIETPVAEVADEDPRLARMRAEAVLLISKTPLSPRKLAQLAHLADATAARTLIRQLNQLYDSVGRAIRIEQVAGGYRMLTRPALAPWLTRLGHLPAAVRLSTPMMETLAVVAYRQPVSRANAEAIRGVACGELLRQLMERDLIRIAGRSEELGRPYLYGTTKRFLQVFGLANTDDLPPITWQTLHEDDSPDDDLEDLDDDPGSRPFDSDNASSDPDLPLDDLSTSTKEPVVSTPVASVLGPAAFGAALAEAGGALATEFGHPAMISPPSMVTVATDDETLELDSIDPTITAAPAAIIEDEEDEIYGDDDDEDDDWDDDDDDDDDDWDDDDDEDEDDDDEEELDDDWEEVDDDDDDEEEDDEADVEEAEVEDDDEDWSEDDDEEDDVESDDDDDEEWD